MCAFHTIALLFVKAVRHCQCFFMTKALENWVIKTFEIPARAIYELPCGWITCNLLSFFQLVAVFACIMAKVERHSSVGARMTPVRSVHTANLSVFSCVCIDQWLKNRRIPNCHFLEEKSKINVSEAKEFRYAELDYGFLLL